MKKRFDGNILLVNLRETYHEVGNFKFKIILNSKFFKSSHKAEINAYDPTNKNFVMDIEKWGRKINCSFTLDDTIPNGVCVIKLKLFNDNDEPLEETFSFWVIK